MMWKVRGFYGSVWLKNVISHNTFQQTDLRKIPVEAIEVFHVNTVHISRGVPEQAVHDVSVRVQRVQDGERGLHRLLN